AFTIKLNKFADHFLCAQQLRDVQNEIGCCHSFAQLSRHMHAHHFRCQKINRLSHHPRFCLNSADAPPNHAKPLDHCRVGIRSNERIREKDFRFLTSDVWLLAKDAFREVFQIDLMHYSDSRRNELESLKRLLTPFEKLVSLAIALELHIQVQF